MGCNVRRTCHLHVTYISFTCSLSLDEVNSPIHFLGKCSHLIILLGFIKFVKNQNAIKQLAVAFNSLHKSKYWFGIVTQNIGYPDPDIGAR